MPTKVEILEQKLLTAELKNKFNNQTRSKKISIRISQEAFEHLKNEAQFKNQSVSEYLNNLILEDWIKSAQKSCNDEVKSLDLFDK